MKRLVVLSLLLTATASAEPVLGVSWVEQPVRAPVAPGDVSPAPPYVRAGDDTGGELRVGPRAAAAFWLDPLDVVRVRVTAGEPRFARVLGGGGARAVLDEPGIPVAPGVFYLTQPPGRGDVWMVWAREAATLTVERPVRLRGRAVWDDVERDVLAWIDRGDAGPPPPLPLVPGAGEVRLRLIADRQLGIASREVAVSRRARARAWLLGLRPLAEGPFALRELELPGAGASARLDVDDEERAPWQRIAGGAKLVVELDGPGVVRVETRGLIAGAATRGPVRAAIRSGDRLLAASTTDADPVNAPDATTPPPAFPTPRPLVTDGGEPAGERAAATAVLLRGRQKLEITVEGGPLLARVVHARRRPRLHQRASWGDADVTYPWPPPAGAPPELRWVLLLEEARRRQGEALRELLDELTETPPPEILPLLADLLPEPTLVERARSPQVAALELAYRARPLDPDVRAGYRAAWRAATSSLVPPDDDPGGGGKKAPRPPAWTWMVESAEPVTTGLTPVPLGKVTSFVAAPAPGDATRAARLDVYVRTGADAPGPVTVRVGDRAFSTLALEPLERLEIAVAPGAHDVLVDAPAGTAAWTNLAPATPTAPTAALRRYWPLTEEGHSLRYELPDPGVPGPVRLALRALAPRAGEPTRILIRTDVGERRTLELTPGTADLTALPLDAPGQVSGEVSFTLRLPPFTRTLWLSSSGKQPIVAQVSVRRAANATAAATPPPAPRGGEPYAAIATLSRALLAAPADTAALVARAGLLLDVDQPDLARQDVLRLSRLSLSPSSGAAVNALLDRLDAAHEPATLDAAQTPLALAPGLLGLAPAEALAPLVPIARAARRLGPADARAALPEDTTPAHAYLRARFSEDPFDLARVAVATDHLPLLVEAGDRLLASLDHRGAASLLFGLAARARERAGHPRARRAFAVAAALSRWDPLEGTAENAGTERIQLDEATPQAGGALAREALLAPPWNPRRAHTLQPGATAAVDLELSGPTKLTTQVFCAELRVRPGVGDATRSPVESGPGCVVTVRVNGQELRARAAAGADAGTVPPRTLPAGRHRIEVTLARDEPRVLASVRFLTDRPLGPLGVDTQREAAGYVVPIDRQQRFFVATPARPVSLSILGPTTLRVELRAASPVTVTVGETTREVAVSPGAEAQILVTAAGAHRVTITPRSGRALVRLALRADAAGTPPPLPAPWWEDAAPSSLLPWPALQAPLAILPAGGPATCPPGEAGTISAEVAGGGEALGERDAANSSLVLEVGAAYRRRAGDALWLRFGAGFRAREGTGPIAAAAAEAYARELPLELRADLRASVTTQRYVDGQAVGLSAALRLDRSFSLSPTVSLVPAVTVRAAYLSLDRATVTATPDEPLDPEVYNDYLRTRPLLATGRASLFWAPFQDQLAELMVYGAAYSALDQAGAGVEWRALFPILGETFTALAYRPSYRMETPDRLDAFLRHDLAARLRWSIWTGRAGRIVVGLDGAVQATAASARATAGFVLRYDWTGGRGLRDILPIEESFESLIEKTKWEAP